MSDAFTAINTARRHRAAVDAASILTMTITQDFGEKGVRASFLQDGSWQPGRAWSIGPHGVSGRCRDYANGSRSPLETHGNWPLDLVRGLEKYLQPAQAELNLGAGARTHAGGTDGPR